MLWKFDLSQLKKIKLKDYVIRFAFGGTVSVLAALIAQLTNGRFGGIFTAFPAILLASLTIIKRDDGKHAAEEDTRGGIIGAIAFVLIAIMLALTLTLLPGIVALLLALLLWLLCALGLYLLSYKLDWLHVNKH